MSGENIWKSGSDALFPVTCDYNTFSSRPSLVQHYGIYSANPSSGSLNRSYRVTSPSPVSPINLVPLNQGFWALKQSGVPRRRMLAEILSRKDLLTVKDRFRALQCT
uniref:Uncharacterized protein n=1 Tax=Sphaerodactylus townsendi TaxID=933632 RepID=A0ACB8EU98_9SAUR